MNGATATTGGDRWPWFVLVLILLVVAALRVRLLGVPLERDEGEYAYVGQLILQGIPPYQLAYTMKLPGTHRFKETAGLNVVIPSEDDR